ncbi:hypothetical protein [Nesterenkonia alkaliphila]|uniref:Lipoprotein n=1 Tax=Nesterenkonia alkaliphila TaxID=1463631 RepID=A0A7K1UKT1_9MICC|nr:hypothetical protein [Nesterenkonia alkaliphila]MVT26611.1 hypothetical protein [Nesterenkonia alkaliphila]GFZ92194.1 hypothetical protein GCM10011359_21860 [Nesterenkonia alkaliphila]
MIYRLPAAIGGLTLSLTLAACNSSEDETNHNDDVPGNADSNNNEDAEEQDGGTGAEPAGESESHGEATWMGEELNFTRSGCGTGDPEPDVRWVRALGDDVTLNVLLGFDPDASDDNNVVLATDDVEVVLDLPGEIGTTDYELYRGSTELGTGVSGDANSVSGSLHLDLDSAVSQGDDINPDGGELTFDLTC